MGYFQLLLTMLIINAGCQKFAGDPCVHVKHATNGVCRSISDCPSAIAGLASQIMPQACGFVGTAPIVCCPIKLEIDEILQTTTGLKSLQKCKEYAKHVYQTIASPLLILNKKIEKVDVCGYNHNKVIVGGPKAYGKEFPHMAAVGYGGPEGERIYICGGSLISENFVLTAGHCLMTRDYGEAKYVRVGVLDLKLQNDDTDPQEFNVIQRIKHPEFVPPSWYNDIGLLRLEKNIRFSAYVRPICLTYETTLRDERAIATGWGATPHLSNSSDHLLKVTLDLFSYDDCMESFKVKKRNLARGINDSTQMCAGIKTEKLDICQFDSGGPLQVYSRDQDIYCMYKLLGVSSIGTSCGIAGNPGLYTRVSHYVPWIENVVWP